MNPTFAKAIAAQVPTGMLLVGSTLQFRRRKGTAAGFSNDRRSLLYGGRHCPSMRGTRLVFLDALGPGA